MKPVYVTELEAGQQVQSAFLVVGRELRHTREGRPYLHLELADRTGTIEARLWEHLEAADSIGVESFVEVQGRVELYRGRLQVSIQKIRPLSAQEADERDFFPHTPAAIEELWQQLLGFVRGVTNPWLRRLLLALLSDPELAARYRVAPAAKLMHHAYRGGLLEHVVSLCGLCRHVAEHYRELDPDLLITAAVLHDIGKLDELREQPPAEYTTEGRLLGHILLGLERVRRAMEALPGFPPRLARVVEHLIVSHHGRLEFGSPRPPLFREALVFHFLDDLDSKLGAVRAVLGAPGSDAEWTARVPALERALLRLDQYLKSTEAGDEAPGPAGEATLPLFGSMEESESR